MVLQDALRFLKVMEGRASRMADVWKQPMKVSFVGESGQDTGGLRREFASLLLESLSKTGYLEGSPGRRCFAHDLNALQDGVFRRIGRLIALTTLQGGSGIPMLAPPLAQYILHGSTTGGEVEDIPDMELRTAVLAVSNNACGCFRVD